MGRGKSLQRGLDALRARVRPSASQAAGNVVSVGATLVSGPLAGAVAGAAVEEALNVIGEAFFAKSLTPDEQRRAAVVFEVARREVFNRRASGDSPAQWVLESPHEPRADSVEVLEAGLMRARDQFEERKLEHFGHLLGWLLFRKDLSAADAHHFLSLGSRLTYRQLLVIAVMGDEALRATLPDKQWEASMLWKDMGLVMETAELVDLGVILHEGGLHGPGSYENINPARMIVLLQGSVLYEGMRLSSVDVRARDEVAESFRRIGCIVLGPEH